MLKVNPDSVNSKPPAGAVVRNAFSIDVEDYFQVAAFDAVIDPASWPAREIRVEANVDKLLESLKRNQAHATFFTLGWVAERFPDMIRRIVDLGT